MLLLYYGSSQDLTLLCMSAYIHLIPTDTRKRKGILVNINPMLLKLLSV